MCVSSSTTEPDPNYILGRLRRSRSALAATATGRAQSTRGYSSGGLGPSTRRSASRSSGGCGGSSTTPRPMRSSPTRTRCRPSTPATGRAGSKCPAMPERPARLRPYCYFDIDTYRLVHPLTGTMGTGTWSGKSGSTTDLVVVAHGGARRSRRHRDASPAALGGKGVLTTVKAGSPRVPAGAADTASAGW